MLISDIIAAARQYTQLTGSTWFSQADELRSLNRAYRDVYEKILDSNDEFFIKEVTFLPSTLVQVDDFEYEYSLPADWHRLRYLSVKVPQGYRLFQRFDPLETQNTEGYRYFQDKLRLIFRNSYDSFKLQYYPKPTEYTSVSDDIVYPSQLEPLILAYRIAIDMKKAQGGEYATLEEEYLALWNRFEHATTKRDNFSYPRAANHYRSTMPGW